MDLGRFTAASATRSIGLQGHPDINRFDYSAINPFTDSGSVIAEHTKSGNFHALSNFWCPLFCFGYSKLFLRHVSGLFFMLKLCADVENLSSKCSKELSLLWLKIK